MTLSTIQIKNTETITLPKDHDRKCSFGCKNTKSDCFRELLCILYSNDSNSYGKY